MTQLAKLAQPIPERFVKRDPDSGEPYVPHGVIKQFLLYILGPYDFEQVTILRGNVLERKDRKFIEGKSPLLLTDVVVGATYRLTCEVDGRRTVVEETGEVEHPEQCPHDGARLKNAESDAIKRIANCLGLGLHLWAGELYVLDRWLPVETRTGQSKMSGVESPASAVADGAGVGSATPAPDTPPAQRTSRARTTSSNAKQESPPAEPARPEPTAEEEAPAATAPPPPDVAAGAASNGHPADQAQTMEELLATLDITLTSVWLRLRRAAQAGQLPDQFGKLADADAVKQLTGEDLDLARAWLIDHSRGAAT